MLTPEQLKAIEGFRAEMLRIRSELRDVQFALRRDVDNLKSWVTALNVGVVPVTVAIVVLVLALRRPRRPLPGKRRRRRRHGRPRAISASWRLIVRRERRERAARWCCAPAPPPSLPIGAASASCRGSPPRPNEITGVTVRQGADTLAIDRRDARLRGGG